MASFQPIPPPDGSSFEDQLVRRVEPWLTEDLDTFCRAVAGMFAQVVLYSGETEDEEGWVVLFDPDACPAEALPYLAQVVGENLPVGISEPLAREWIKDNPNASRGTPQAVFLATQRKLTGSRAVVMTERADGVVDKVRIITYGVQTPDPTGTLQDILSVLPADVILDYQVKPAALWDDTKATYASWDVLRNTGKTWAEVYVDTPGDTFWRPQPT